MVPLLITMDLEIAWDYDLNEQRAVLVNLCRDLEKLNLPITIFTTSEAVDYLSEQTRLLHACNNEFGCHGVNHIVGENYQTMKTSEISKSIVSATIKIEDIIGLKPTSFRGPGMTTSSQAQKILSENGYKTDFSICSQRFDIYNTAGGNIGWLFCPRFPYHPSEKSPYRKGNLPIWVVPLSSIGLPFISGVLYMFGLDFMKLFFHLLLKESSITSKPIVYLFHSYEFCRYIGHAQSDESPRDFKIPNRKMIHRLYRKDKEIRYKMNVELLKSILSNKMIRPFTAMDYFQYLNSCSN